MDACYVEQRSSSGLLVYTAAVTSASAARDGILLLFDHAKGELLRLSVAEGVQPGDVRLMKCVIDNAPHYIVLRSLGPTTAHKGDNRPRRDCNNSSVWDLDTIRLTVGEGTPEEAMEPIVMALVKEAAANGQQLGDVVAATAEVGQAGEHQKCTCCKLCQVLLGSSTNDLQRWMNNARKALSNARARAGKPKYVSHCDRIVADLTAHDAAPSQLPETAPDAEGVGPLGLAGMVGSPPPQPGGATGTAPAPLGSQSGPASSDVTASVTTQSVRRKSTRLKALAGGDGARAGDGGGSSDGSSAMSGAISIDGDTGARARGAAKPAGTKRPREQTQRNARLGVRPGRPTFASALNALRRVPRPAPDPPPAPDPSPAADPPPDLTETFQTTGYALLQLPLGDPKIQALERLANAMAKRDEGHELFNGQTDAADDTLSQDDTARRWLSLDLHAGAYTPDQQQVVEDAMPVIAAALAQQLPGLPAMEPRSNKSAVIWNSTSTPDEKHVHQALHLDNNVANMPKDTKDRGPAPNAMASMDEHGNYMWAIPGGHKLVEKVVEMIRAGKYSKNYAVHNMARMVPTAIHVPRGQMLVMHPFLPHAGHGGFTFTAASRVFMELQWQGQPDYSDAAINARAGGTFLFGQLSPHPFRATPELADIFMSPSLERVCKAYM